MTQTPEPGESRTGQQHRQAGKGPEVYSGDKARQGDIILRSRRRRTIFIAGLVGLLLLGLLVRLCAGPA